jgi:hypothetical protein
MRRLQNVAKSVGEKRRPLRTNWGADRREIEPRWTLEREPPDHVPQLRGEHNLIAATRIPNPRRFGTGLYAGFEEIEESGQYGKFQKVNHGLSFIITARDHRESMKRELAIALARGVTVTVWARARCTRAGGLPMVK